MLSHWRADPETGPNFCAWETLPPSPADLRPIPTGLLDPLRQALASQGIEALYSHQAETWTAVRSGKNVVVATGTASGTTLAYNLPVLTSMLEDPQARALYLFPTKALAQDQLNALSRFRGINPLAAIYDGDTPQRDRKPIRERARIVLANPDMLHTGILPHHTNWEEFFRNLRIRHH